MNVTPSTESPLLEVAHLGVRFVTDALTFDAVFGVSFNIHSGKIYCLVGESGCGKSLTAKALLRLIPDTARISGSAKLHGEDMLQLSPSDMLKLRGRHISMIFQEPMTSLNPVMRVGQQVMEPLRLHLKLGKDAARLRCVELFREVGIPSPESRLEDYPHQLSGGMRQRVMIAMALACRPALLLADEPTTALDVTIQGQILQLIRRLSRENGMGVLLITHDLGVVAQMADDVGVMYAGHMVESGPVDHIFENPLHPYTRGLMRSAPTRMSRHVQRLAVIPGNVPPPGTMPPGCAFHPRCADAMPRCTKEAPPQFFEERTPGTAHAVRCWLHENLGQQPAVPDGA